MVFAACRSTQIKLFGVTKSGIPSGLIHLCTYELVDYKVSSSMTQPPPEIEEQYTKIDKELILRESLLSLDSSLDPKEEGPGKVQLAVGGVGTHIYLIDPVKGESVGVLQGHMNTVMDVKFSKKRPSWLLSASTDQAVLLWNTKTRQQLAHFHEIDYKNHYTAFTCLTWYEDNFAVGNADGRVHLWTVPFTVDSLASK